MRFGRIALDEAEGAVLAHSVTTPSRRWPKAHRLDAEDIAQMRREGVGGVSAALFEPGDVGEDQAAERIAEALVTAGIECRPATTGRVNMHASVPGVFTVSRRIVDALNAIDPAITIATLAEMSPVEAGRMVATVKIIPFAVAGALVEEAERIAAREQSMAVHAYRAARVGLVQTVLPSVKQSVLDKTARITAERLGRSGSTIAVERRVSHDEGAVAEAIKALRDDCDMLLVFGASAMSDRRDVIPAAILGAGGTVERVGMPVDPGNLLVLGEVGGKPVIGAPGCARSPKPNGFDWVLDRLLAGIDVRDADIAAMGVGGLLMEIATRPQPREAGAPPRAAPIGAILLAAGQSRRMGGPNKLLAEFDGVPLVRRSAHRLAAAGVVPVVAVVGHQGDRIRSALEGLDLAVAENADFASGLASSIRTGLAAMPETIGGLLVALADMPEISTQHYDRLIDAFREAGGNAIIRATVNGKRGNPVILPRSLFEAVSRLVGDMGARHLVEGGAAEVVDVELGAAAGADVDTPDAMMAAGGSLRG